MVIISKNKTYTVFHLHDDTSNCNGFADSTSGYQEYIDLAVEQDMSSIAFSNHGGIYEWISKKQACDKAGLKYIHGVELYLTEKLENNHRGYHIGLYAKNLKGVKELNRLISQSTSRGDLSNPEDTSDRHFYYNPRISFEELMSTSDDIIITTACLASPLWQLSKRAPLEDETEQETIERLSNNNDNRTKLLEWMSKNSDRCFLEVQYHDHPEQKEFNKLLHEWSLKYDIPLIAGTDTHSSSEYKAKCREILQISKNSFYGAEDTFDLVWKTYDELVEMFEIQGVLPKDVILEAIENTNVLADMVEEFELNDDFKYPTLYGDDAHIVWRDLILEKFEDKVKSGIIDKEDIPEFKSMIAEEYKIMVEQGMSSFMMFMSELMTWCRKNEIYASPNRGSISGAVAYVTDIIDVNPVKWGTVFSRFCNADRVTLGD